jgi:hypothetical protein
VSQLRGAVQDYAVAKLNHLPGCGREMAANVAYRKQSGKPVGLAGRGDTVPPPKGGGAISRHAQSLRQGDRSLAVGLHGQYPPGERGRSRLLRIGNIHGAISERASGLDSALIRFTRMLFVTVT